MTHADKTQETQKKSVTNEVSQRHNSVDSTFQFVDNRPEAVAQRNLQEVVNNSPQVKQIAQLQAMTNNYSARQQQPITQKNNTGIVYSVVQRKVIVENKPAALIDNKTAYVNGTHVDVGTEKADWVIDRYVRNYKSTKEFEDHVQDSPVDVGLARKLGKWYRIPFFSENKFFVLGENHGAFGYRELIKESNQPGNVLGESGSNKLMSAEPTTELQENSKGLKDELKEPREHTMENIVAKTYFGLTYLQKSLEKEAKGSSSSSAKKPDKVPEKEWLENYQNAPPEKRGAGAGLNAIPFYLNASNEKIYATYGTKAENYDTTNTANKILSDFKDEIDAYTGLEFDNLKNAREALYSFLSVQKNEPYNHSRLLGKLNNLLVCMLNLSFSEAQKITGGDPTESLKARYKKVKVNQSKWDTHMQKAMAHRDYIMYLSVVKAKPNHIMAGMGDHHATNLKEDLEKIGIPVVLFNEFLSTYSTDAIAPLEEVEGYPESVKQTEEQKSMYVKTMMKIPPQMNISHNMYAMLTTIDLSSLGGSLNSSDLQVIIDGIYKGALPNLSSLVLDQEQLNETQISKIIAAPQKIALRIIDRNTLNF